MAIFSFSTIFFFFFHLGPCVNHIVLLVGGVVEPLFNVLTLKRLKDLLLLLLIIIIHHRNMKHDD